MTIVSTDSLSASPNLMRTGDAYFAPAEVLRDDRTVIWICGEHDLSTSASLAVLVDQAISFDDSDVEIDLSGLRYMSSATIHVINDAREYLRLRSRSLTLTSPTPIASRLLDLCGVAIRTD